MMLSEQQMLMDTRSKPVAYVSRKGFTTGGLVWTKAGIDADLPDETKLYTHPAPASDEPLVAPKVEHEPVAWRYRSAERPHLGWTKPEYSRRSPYGRIGMDEQPLFTHPAQAAATIRELEERAAHFEKAFAAAQNADAEASGLLRDKLRIAEGMVAEANCSLFGSQSFFGDDKTHISRAIEALKLESGNRWRALKIATEALGQIEFAEGEINPDNYDHDDACALNDSFVECVLGARKALARIKEVG